MARGLWWMNRWKTNETTLTMIEPQKAPQGHWTKKPTPICWQIQEENQSRKALITSINRPTVRMMKAHESSLRTGRIKTLTSASTTAMTAKASQADVPWTDIRDFGRISVATNSAMTVMSQWMKNFIGNPFHVFLANLDKIGNK